MAYITKEKKEILVSVVIPIYNAGDFLRPLLDSIIHQFDNHKDIQDSFEIILCLDSPTDESDFIAKEYSQKKPTLFKIISHPNVGLVENRNIGMRAARGEYLMWADHDDEFAENAFIRIYEMINSKNPDIINFRVEYINRNGDIISVGPELPRGKYSPREYSVKIKSGWWMLWNNAIKRKIIEKYQIYPNRHWLTEDVDLRVKAYYHAQGHVAVIHDPLYRWRILGNSTSHNHSAPLKYLTSGVYYLIHHLNYSLKCDIPDKKYWSHVLRNTAKTNFVLKTQIRDYKIPDSVYKRTNIFLKSYIRHYGIPFYASGWRIIISCFLFYYAEMVWPVFLKFIGYKNRIFSILRKRVH